MHLHNKSREAFFYEQIMRHTIVDMSRLERYETEALTVFLYAVKQSIEAVGIAFDIDSGFPILDESVIKLSAEDVERLEFDLEIFDSLNDEINFRLEGANGKRKILN